MPETCLCQTFWGGLGGKPTQPSETTHVYHPPPGALNSFSVMSDLCSVAVRRLGPKAAKPQWSRRELPWAAAL